jgi:hypothetical protein
MKRAMKWTPEIIERWRRVSRRTLIVFSGLILLLVALRLALPFIVENYVNHKLNTAKDYAGKIGTVSMQLWRGGYQINGLQILRKSVEGQSPLFSARKIDLAIAWGELFHGTLAGEVILWEPKINFVGHPPEEKNANGKNERWDQMIAGLFPFDLNRAQIFDGEIHFQNEYSKPPVDVYLSKLSATATNLTNARNLSQQLPAGLIASGSTVGGGELNLQLHMNLVEAAPAYEMNLAVTNVALLSLNDFLRAYGKFDVDRGNFSLYSSLAAQGGSYQGYFKVFFSDLSIFAWDKERKKNILEVFWQAIIGGVATVFKNHPHDQLAAKIPISGSYSNSSVGLWTTTGTVLQNAFIHALVPKLDQPVTVDQVEKNKDDK